jgi:immune inhibitor A
MYIYNSCLVPPDPNLVKKLKEEYKKEKKKNKKLTEVEFFVKKGYFKNKIFGLDNNIIKDPDEPINRDIALMPLPKFKPRGDVNVLFLLVDFSDQPHTQTVAHFKKLLFSEGNSNYNEKSLKEYYKEVSYGEVNVIGYVSDWIRMPRPYAYYVNGEDGTGPYPTNTQKLVEEAVEIAKKSGQIEWDIFDLNGDGKIEALSVLHAGSGAEQTGAGQGDIWSHKHQTTKKIHVTNKTYALTYLTVPEDSRLGVIAHELGHLLFEWPDLYDAGPRNSTITQGLGDWCLMAGGSWNNKGNTPAYPSAWCRYGQGWSTTINITSDQELIVKDIERNKEVYRLWTKGQDSAEYFILENRQKAKFDKYLPGNGILIYHIDEKAINNWNEDHLGVGLMQADGRRDLQSLFNGNQGDDGDPFPGSSKNLTFGTNTKPNSRSYLNKNTNVYVNLLNKQSSKAIKIKMRV